MRKTLDSLECYTATASKLLVSGASTEVLRIDFPHAGTWLVFSFMDLDKNDNNAIYVHGLSSTDMSNPVRSTPSAGGGSTSWIVTESSYFTVYGYIASANVTARVKVAYICLS